MAFSLGQITVREAVTQELESSIADVTGLELWEVRGTLAKSRGNMLVKNAFSESWPSTAEQLAQLRVTVLRENGLVDDLRRLTDLSAQTISRRLKKVRGNTMGKNLFPELFGVKAEHGEEDADDGEDDPDDVDEEDDAGEEDGEEDSGEDEQEESSYQVEESSRVVNVREDPSAWEQLANETGLSVAQVRSRLQEKNGRMLVQNAFPELRGDAPEEASTGDTTHAPERRDLVTSRWLLGKKLGQGGFGEAYEATDIKHHGLKVVLKFSTQDGGAELIFEEMRSAFELSHQNICSYIDAGVDKARGAFVIMKIAGKFSLEDLILKRGALPLDDCLEIARQVAAGLDYAHDEGVMHGDIKPSNILIRTRKNDTLEARIVDFGVARPGQIKARTRGGFTMATTKVIGVSFILCRSRADLARSLEQAF